MYSHLYNKFTIKNKEFVLKSDPIKEAELNSEEDFEEESPSPSSSDFSDDYGSEYKKKLEKLTEPKHLLLYNNFLLFISTENDYVSRIDLSNNKIDKVVKFPGPILKLTKLSEATLGITYGYNGDTLLQLTDINLEHRDLEYRHGIKPIDAKSHALFWYKNQLLNLTNFTSILKITNAFYRYHWVSNSDRCIVSEVITAHTSLSEDFWDLRDNILIKIYFDKYFPYHNILLDTIIPYKKGFACVSQNIDNFIPVIKRGAYSGLAVPQEEIIEYSLSVWEFKENEIEMIFSATLNNKISQLCKRPDGKLITFSLKNFSEHQMHCWDVATQQCVALLRIMDISQVFTQAILLDETRIAVSTSKDYSGWSKILIIDTYDLFYSVIGVKDDIHSLCPLNDGSFMYTDTEGLHCKSVDTQEMRLNYFNAEMIGSTKLYSDLVKLVLDYLDHEIFLNLIIPEKYTYQVTIHKEIPIDNVEYPTFFREVESANSELIHPDIYVGNWFSPYYKFDPKKFTLESSARKLDYKKCENLSSAKITLPSSIDIWGCSYTWTYQTSHPQVKANIAIDDPHVESNLYGGNTPETTLGINNLVVGSVRCRKLLAILNVNDCSSRYVEFPYDTRDVLALQDGRFAAIGEKNKRKVLTLFSLHATPKKSYNEIMQDYSPQFFQKYQPKKIATVVSEENLIEATSSNSNWLNCSIQ